MRLNRSPLSALRGAVVVLVLMVAACGGQKSAGLQDGAQAPDTGLFENGMTYLDKNQHIKARLSFQTLINTYPDSDYTPSAFLGIADSYYAEGGIDSLLQAEAQYKDFLIFYPTHEMADDAQLKIAAINYRMMKPYDRDPTYAKKAQIELQRFIDNHPDSELTPSARYFLKDVEEILARGIHEVGEFYYNREKFDAAGSRYGEVLDEFPDFSRRDATHFHYAKALEGLGRITEATAQYLILATEYPFSRHFKAAQDRLVLLEEPIPTVDEAAAERRLSNVKEEKFSFTAPITALKSAFVGRPDIYELARKQAAQQGVPLDAPPPQADKKGESKDGKNGKKPDKNGSNNN